MPVNKEWAARGGNKFKRMQAREKPPLHVHDNSNDSSKVFYQVPHRSYNAFKICSERFYFRLFTFCCFPVHCGL